MDLRTLYRQFNQLINDRNMTYPKIVDLDRVPDERVIDSWCEDLNIHRPGRFSQEAHPAFEDPVICHKLSVTAMCIKIAQTQGMDAAMIWKLQNG